MQTILAIAGTSACSSNHLNIYNNTRTTQTTLEPIFAFNGAMPTGVTVSDDRIFVCFPTWDDHVSFSVAEILPNPIANRKHSTSQLKPFPSQAINNSLMSVQSVVADQKGVLWILDTGSPKFIPPSPGTAKLISIDLTSHKILRIYPIPSSVMLKHTYINDVRFDLGVGLPSHHPGFAYITGSSSAHIGSIIVLDLHTGKAIRRLSNTKYTNPDPHFIPIINGKPLLTTDAHNRQVPSLVATDSIEISPNKENLYFSPLLSRHLYSAPTRLLRDSKVHDKDIIASIVDYGANAATDGLAIGPNGTLYAGDYEHSRIRKLTADGHWHTISDDPRITWPDSLSVSRGYLYFIANQLPQLPSYNQGHDLRKKPYWLFRIKIS